MIRQFNSEIFILGMGICGISLAKYIIKNKNPVTCWDDNPEKRKVSNSLKIKIDNMTSETLKYCNYLVLSPGINHQKRKPHEAVKVARSLNIKIVTDLEFLKILNIKNPLIGVTGTNGKSTTSYFMSQILYYNNFK